MDDFGPTANQKRNARRRLRKKLKQQENGTQPAQAQTVSPTALTPEPAESAPEPAVSAPEPATSTSEAEASSSDESDVQDIEDLSTMAEDVVAGFSFMREPETEQDSTEQSVPTGQTRTVWALGQLEICLKNKEEPPAWLLQMVLENNDTPNDKMLSKVHSYATSRDSAGHTSQGSLLMHPPLLGAYS